MLVTAVVWAVAFHTAAGARIDSAVLDAFAGFRDGPLGSLAGVGVGLADPLPFAATAIAILAVGVARRLLLEVAVAAVVLVGANVATQLLKSLATVPRPADRPWAAPLVDAWPSGHMTAAITLGACLVLVAPQRLRRAAAVGASLFALAEGCSLLILGWHYPSDVLGACGVVLSCVALGLAAAGAWFLPSGRQVRAVLQAEPDARHSRTPEPKVGPGARGETQITMNSAARGGARVACGRWFLVWNRDARSRARIFALLAAVAAGIIFAAFRPTASDWAQSWPPMKSTWHGRCDKVASLRGSDDNPGTVSAPFRSPQALAETLGPGQTGCLRGGVYRANGQFVLDVGASGSPEAPITIRSYSRERARLLGITEVRQEASWVKLADMDFIGDGSQNTIKIYGTDVTIEGSDITNRQHGRSCVILGSPEQGVAVRPRIQGNRLHDCGNPTNGNQDHAIYASNTVDGRIVDNYFADSAAYAVQFYPDAQRMQFSHNIVDGGGDSIRGGILFGGDEDSASSNNLVTRNVIAFAATYGVTSDWEGSRGVGNVVRNNCFWHAADASVDDAVGFRASMNIVAEPKFRNRRRGDYRMPPGNPCRRVLG